MTYGCVKDEKRFSSRVEDQCLDAGTWYEKACGPRDGYGSFLLTPQWARVYTEHRNFDSGRVQRYAGRFGQLSSDSGGGSNGYDAQIIADAWFKRDVSLAGDQAAPFYRAVCKEMRKQLDYDFGPGHTNYSDGSMTYLTGGFLYESCKFHNGFELVR